MLFAVVCVIDNITLNCGCFPYMYTITNVDAEQLFVQLLRAPGRLNAATIGAVNALLQGYLAQNLAHEDLAFKVSGLRELLAKNNIGTDRKGYSLYLEAGLYLNDLRLAMYAFKALKSQAQGCLQYVTDELLTGLLMELWYVT